MSGRRPPGGGQPASVTERLYDMSMQRIMAEPAAYGTNG